MHSSYRGGTIEGWAEESREGLKTVTPSVQLVAKKKKSGNNKAEIKRRIQVARVRTLPRRLSCIDAEQTDSCHSRADGFAGGRRRDLRPVKAHVKLVAFFLLKTWPPGNPFGEE